MLLIFGANIKLLVHDRWYISEFRVFCVIYQHWVALLHVYEAKNAANFSINTQILFFVKKTSSIVICYLNANSPIVIFIEVRVLDFHFVQEYD